MSNSVVLMLTRCKGTKKMAIGSEKGSPLPLFNRKICNFASWYAVYAYSADDLATGLVGKRTTAACVTEEIIETHRYKEQR